MERIASGEAKSPSYSTTQRTETHMMCFVQGIGLESESARLSAVTKGFRASLRSLVVMILYAKGQVNVQDVTQTLQEKVCVDEGGALLARGHPSCRLLFLRHDSLRSNIICQGAR